MGWTILLTILFVLAVILLLPVRVKGFFAEGKWGVSVYYAWFRLFHKVRGKSPARDPAEAGGCSRG